MLILQVLNVAQLARKAVAELLATAKAAAAAAENDQHAEQVRASAQACVKALLLVMDSVLMVGTCAVECHLPGRQ